MKTKTRNLVILLIGFVIISGCNSKPSEVDLQGTQEQDQNTHQAETAVFETAVIVLLTERAPTATLTITPSPTVTETLVPSITPTMTIMVIRDPWIFQDICLTDPTACVKYTINNMQLKIWIQVVLIDQETGESANFSIAPKSIGTITLVPGVYQATYTGDCPGYLPATSVYRTGYLGELVDSFRCKGTLTR